MNKSQLDLYTKKKKSTKPSNLAQLQLTNNKLAICTNELANHKA